MKKFTVMCDFNGQKSPFALYIGEPKEGNHPLHFQQDWLARHRGGNIPGEIMEKALQVYNLAKQNNVSFEELWAYVFNHGIDINARN